jgi:hypothetical protein
MCMSVCLILINSSKVITMRIVAPGSGKPPSKKKKRGKNLSPRNSKTCHTINTALMQRVDEIGTQSTMKSRRKTSYEFSSHIPKKRRKGNKVVRRTKCTTNATCLVWRKHTSILLTISGERSTIATMLMDYIPGARALGTSFNSTIGLSTCVKSSCLKRGLLLTYAGLAVGGPPYSVGSFSTSSWGCGLIILHGSTSISCC